MRYLILASVVFLASCGDAIPPTDCQLVRITYYYQAAATGGGWMRPATDKIVCMVSVTPIERHKP